MSKLEVTVDRSPAVMTARETKVGHVYLWASPHGERPLLRVAHERDDLHVFYGLDNWGQVLCQGSMGQFHEVAKATLSIER